MSDDIVGSRLTVPVAPGNRHALREIAALFTRLGCTAFGGPAAHVALMESEVVTKRRWMTRGEFLDQLGVVQLLPGPNSTELAIHVGQARGGWRGALVAGLCFVLPSAVCVWLLVALSSGPMVRPMLDTVLRCVAPMVVALLLQALWKFGRQATERRHARFVMPLTAVAAFVLPSEMAVLLVGALAAVALAGISTRALAVGVIAVLGGAGATMLWAQAGGAVAPDAPGAAAVFWYFLRAGVSVFGSGYVLFAFLQHDLVDQRHWLTLPALTQASAFAQVTPGPLFTTATAAGFSIAGPLGALAATVGIFAPAFLSVVVSHPLQRLVQRSAVTRAALDGVVVASVALLGRAVAGFGWPMQLWQWAVVAVATALLAGTRLPATLLLLAAVLAGIVAHVTHLPLPAP